MFIYYIMVQRLASLSVFCVLMCITICKYMNIYVRYMVQQGCYILLTEHSDAYPSTVTFLCSERVRFKSLLRIALGIGRARLLLESSNND